MYIYASSLAEIEKKFPEFYVFEQAPSGFNRPAKIYAEMFTSDLDDPSDWLKRYIENDQKDNNVYRNPSLKKKFVDL